MKFPLLTVLLLVIYLTLIFQPLFASGDTIHFDSEGKVVDKIHYEIIVSEWEKALRLKLRYGYSWESTVWRDPIKLRKKRILQWQILRSIYNPDSLPENIIPAKIDTQS